MLILVESEDVKLCTSLAVMCKENNFDIVFKESDIEKSANFDCIVLDLDYNYDKVLDECEKYKRDNDLIFGVISVPTKSAILKAKEAGCLIVLTKPNFSANFLDIINRTKK